MSCEARLAACGIYCAACYAHLRRKNPCPGCRGPVERQPLHCRNCNIRGCAAQNGVKFCGECAAFPCTLIKRMDKTNRQRYQVSLVGNGMRIKSVGGAQFLLEEKTRWTCPDCGGMISLHERTCSVCGAYNQMDRTIL